MTKTEEMVELHSARLMLSAISAVQAYGDLVTRGAMDRAATAKAVVDLKGLVGLLERAGAAEDMTLTPGVDSLHVFSEEECACLCGRRIGVEA